ncbi:MAG: hypothetical protein ACYDH6_06295 [Acidimicrobiales bacterium]
MVTRSLRMPVVGRSTAGMVVLALSTPMCRLTGLTADARTARRLGTAVALTDFAGVIHVIASSTSRGQRKAAVANAILDVLLATGLLALGSRRNGRERVAALLASASVWIGAGAWLVGARQLQAQERTVGSVVS